MIEIFGDLEQAIPEVKVSKRLAKVVRSWSHTKPDDLIGVNRLIESIYPILCNLSPCETYTEAALHATPFVTERANSGIVIELTRGGKPLKRTKLHCSDEKPADIPESPSEESPPNCIPLSDVDPTILWKALSIQAHPAEILRQQILNLFHRSGRDDANEWDFVCECFHDSIIGSPSNPQLQGQIADIMINDLLNVLIFNKAYQNRHSINDNLDVAVLQNLCNQYIYKDNDGSDRYYRRYTIPFNLEDIQFNFCRYSIYAILLQWESEFRNGARSAPYLFGHVYCSEYSVKDERKYEAYKGRAFNAMLNALTGNVKHDPKIKSYDSPTILDEDIWYLEKVTGIRTVMALFPIVHNAVDAVIKTYELTNEFLEIVMQCRPIRIRAFIAEQVSLFLQAFYYDMYLQTDRQPLRFQKKKVNMLLATLKKDIQLINWVYQSALNATTCWYQDGLLDLSDAETILREREAWRNQPIILTREALKGNERSHKMMKLMSLLCIPSSAEVFQVFRHEDPLQKEISIRNSKTAFFAGLQNRAIAVAAINYGYMPEKIYPNPHST